jgi:hypothetical protein
LSFWLRATTNRWITPSIVLPYEYTDKIHGMDKELLVGGPFLYPALVTNTDLFGGEKATLILGVRIPIVSVGRYIDLEVGKPVYQNLNGLQKKDDIHFGFKFNVSY